MTMSAVVTAISPACFRFLLTVPTSASNNCAAEMRTAIPP